LLLLLGASSRPVGAAEEASHNGNIIFRFFLMMFMRGIVKYMKFCTWDPIPEIPDRSGL
jgi:hypothetical protein